LIRRSSACRLLLVLLWGCSWRVSAQVITNVVPPPGATLSNLTQITVSFDKPVSGVDAADFLVNDEPAGAVTGPSGTNCYTFTFTPPSAGLVGISWNESPEIIDLASNRFDPNGPEATWQYTLLDTTAPTVADQTPPPGATVRRFTQLEVHFSEAVSGVEASDLLINGQPAGQLTILGADRYRFQFPQPADGTVQLAWTTNHGIRDLATPPNAFAGGHWTNVLDPAYALARVRLNEFLAGNFDTNGLRDEFGELEDWIELYNYGTSSVDLAGYSLTDDPDFPGKWVFPSVTLAAGQYLVVFASGRNLTVVGATNRLHTSFSLGSAGEYLGLYNAESPRAVLSEFAPGYPEQRNNYSYGYDSANALKYFSVPTPGAANGSSTITGVVAEVHCSVERGFFNQPFTLVIDTPTPGATIRYTTNGTPPTETSGLIYTNPLTIGGLTTLRALACRTSLLPSRVQTHTYIFLANVINQPTNPPGFPINVWNLSGQTSDYGMDPRVVTNVLHSNTITGDLLALPALSIVLRTEDMFGGSGFVGIYTNTKADVTYEVPCSIELVNPDGSSGFQIDCGIRQHGGSSRNNPMKKPFGLKFRGQYGDAKLHYPFFPDTQVEEFNSLVLRPEYNNSWTHSSDASQRARGTLVRDAIAKDLQGAMGDLTSHSRYVHLYINGLYWGVYNPCEDTDDDFGASYLGGDSSQYDAIKGASSKLSVDGDLVAYNAMVALANIGLVDLAQYEQIQQYLDVTQFADYMILQLYGANNDWAAQNNWAAIRQRETNATFKWLCWDNERILEGTNESRIGTSPTSANLQSALMNSGEYQILFADRIHKHLFNGGTLTPAKIASLWLARASQLDRAIVGESARWGDAAYSGKPALSPLPYPGYTVGFPYTREENFLGEQGRLVTNYFPVRTAIVLNQFRSVGWYPSVDAPEFNQFGGRVPSGFNLVVTSAVNTIYFTTNGADPRVYGTGAVSDSAKVYSGAITLSRDTVVKARVLAAGTWSALTEATFTVGALGVPLRFTEIMYNPAPGGSSGDAYEYIELQNTGALTVSLGGDYFDGITYIFQSGTALAPGARLIVGASDNTNAFFTRYPTATNIAGWFSGRLSNSGEKITLYDPAGNIITAVTYGKDGGWPTTPNGGGYSLEIVDAAADPDDPANWRASAQTNGTPGFAPTSAPPAISLVLNEIAAENTASVSNGNTFPDWVELFNASTNTVNLSNWSLTDSGNARKYVFPATNIAAGQYLVVWCDAATNTTPGLHAGFALSKSGESVYLFNSSTGLVDAVTYGVQLADYTVGRVGGAWQLTVPTPNATNVAAAFASPTNLVINEWLANTDTGQSDWFEVFNRSTNLPAALRGVYAGTSNALYQINTLSFLPPRGYLQLVADEVAGAGHVDFKLPAAGGLIALYDATGLLLNQVVYGAQNVPGLTQGRLPDGGTNIVSFPGSASPAAANYLLNYTGAVLNEILARYDSVTNGSDWVELFNPGTNAFNLSGFALSDDSGDPSKWVFPANTILPTNQYLVVYCDESRAASAATGTNMNTGFSLSGESGGVYLFNTNRQLADAVDYGFQIKNQSIGRSGGSWQLLAAPTPGTNNSAPAALGAVAGLRINEWMASVSDGDDWFELYNPNALPVLLAGLYLTDDPSLAGQTKFQAGPLSFVPPRGWVKWIADDEASKGRDHVSFKLDAEGESLVIYTTNLAVIDAVAFGLQTGDVSQGRLPDGGTNVVFFPSTPTPGKANYLPPASGLAVNEVLSHTDAPLEDAVEFFNPAGTNVNIGGWYLSNNSDDPKRFRVPDGTIVPAGGFKVFYEYQFNGGAGSLTPFTFNAAHGDEAWLAEADGAGNLTGYRAGAEFGAAENGVSFGRFPTTAGADFTAMDQRTFGMDDPANVAEFRTGTGAANAGPRIGPIVISEIMYHPPDILAGTNYVDDSTNEFVELYNMSGGAVALFDAAAPANTWRLANAVDFAFPTNVTVGAGERCLVVNFNPTNTALLAAFKSKYAITNDVRIFGPYGGKLDNSGETIELYKPDSVQTAPHPDAGFVPQVLVDKVAYQDTAPWPAGAVDGGGLSLQRVLATAYGNEPTNWFAGTPTAGQSGSDALAIVSPPQDRTAYPGERVEFAVTAQGVAPLSYQWLFNGATFTNQTATNLVITNVLAGHAGNYRVRVTNLAGSVLSDAAVLTVATLPIGHVALTGGGTMRLTYPVLAGRAYQLEYKTNLMDPEWIALGTPFVAETNTLVLDVDIRAYPQRFYRLAIHPLALITQPQSQQVYLGESIEFTVTARSSVSQGYQWWFNSEPLPGQTASNLVYAGAQMLQTGTYSVQVANMMGCMLSDSITLAVLEPPSVEAQLVNPGTLRISSRVLAGRTCRLEYKNNLTDPAWIATGTPVVAGTNAVTLDDDISAQARRFYRLVISR
jgi:hypothetical protein